MKSRMRWAGHVAYVGVGGRMCAGFWQGNLTDRGYIQDLGIGRWLILIWILKEIAWTGFILVQGQAGDCCMHGCEPVDSVKYWDLLT
jgi:hypothetical protein